MFYGAGAEPGEHDFERDAAEPPWGQPRRGIGHIHTIVGSFTVARAGAILVHLKVGDPVFAGDEVETGADSTVGIHFSDGTVCELSACARMVLSEFACDGARSSSALFVLSKGAIAFMAGKAAKGGLSIDTPIARIRGSRGGGIVSLAVAALTFAALKAVRADDQPVIDDGRVELPHGTFELVTKEQVPQVIVVDDPWKTVVLQKVGSTVDVKQVTNSFERMDELGEVSRDTFAIFRDGQRDLFIQRQQHASLGSSETISDFSRPGISTVSLVSPTNLINSDFSPADRVATIPVAVAAASVPEVAAVVPTTIVESPAIGFTPATIILAAVAEQTFIDTSALDLFTPVNGALSATAANNATLTYGIAGGTADNSLGGYNQSLTDAYGTLYLSSTTGAYTFVPNDTAINALTTPTAANFTLTVSNGTVSAQETITFALNGANDAPTLQPVTGPTYPDDVESNGALAASNPFAPVTGTLIGADVDLPAQTLTYGIVDGTTGGNTDEVTYDVSKTGAYGTLYVNSATGNYEFVPNEAAIKALPATVATDTFTFTASDGSLSAEQTFTVTINGVNDAPTLQPVAGPTYTDMSTSNDFAAATGTLVGADVDLPTQTLTYGIVGGSTVLDEVTYDVSKTGAYGTLYVNSATGDYTFVPDDAAIKALPAVSTTEEFTVTVSDGSLSAEQSFTVTIDGVNDAPTLQPVAGPTYIDMSEPGPFSAASGTLIGADVDLPTQTLTYGIVGGSTVLDEVTYDVSKTGAYGTLYVNSATGNYEFVPNEAAIKALPATVATDTFTFTVSDGSLSAEQSFTVTIDGVNDAPTLQPVAGPTYTDMSTSNDFAAATGTLVGADVDLPTQTLTYGIVGGSTVLDEVTYDVSKTGAYGTLYVNSATGDYTFVPDDAAIKALPAVSTTEEFTVTVSDGSLSAEQSFTVTIDGVNDAPTLQPVAGPIYTDTSTSTHFTAVTGTLIGADVDLPAQTLTYGIVDGITGGSTVLGEETYDVSRTGAYGTLYVNSATGDYTFVPNDAAIKALPPISTTDEFTVTVSDGSLSAQRTFTVAVDGVNDEVTISGIGATGGDKTVYEANLTDGSSPNAAALTQTGTFNVSAPDGFDYLTIGGVPVVTNGAVTIPGSAIATTYGALTITNIDLGTGVVSYSYTLSHNALAPGSDDVLDNIPVVLTDTDGSSASDTLIVKVVDDAPKAEPVEVPISSTDSMTNVMLILDLSGSMNDSSGLTGSGGQNLTRLDVAKAAVTELLEQYDARGDVMVRIVTFTGTGTAVWQRLDECR